jgi:pimeloyl-ACP methyl ester carboxylesterase
VRITRAVLQAGVLDLERAADQGLGAGAVVGFLGGPVTSELTAQASPVRLLPTGARVLCVHGEDDDVVPLDQSRRYAAAASAAGDVVEVAVVPGGHMELIDPGNPAWRTARNWLERRRSGAADSTTLGS